MANPIKGAKAGVKLMKSKAESKGKSLTVGGAIKGAVKGVLKPKANIVGAKLVKSVNAGRKQAQEGAKDPVIQAKFKALAPKN